MSIKNTMTRLAEKITGRPCTRCRHNCAGRCRHPNGRMFMKCWQSITRPGYEPRPIEIKARDLPTAQIKPVAPLDEDMERESGLLTED